MSAWMLTGLAPLALSLALLTGTATPGLAKYAVVASADLRGTIDADDEAEAASPLIDEPNAKPTERVVARIDLSEQRMYVYVDNRLEHVWPVSTGARGYGTPSGAYSPDWMTSFWRSKKYHNAPMPWSVFFQGGYAVHGTTDIRHLGRVASHGCVRLHPDNAKAFYKLVQRFGMASTLISVVQ